MSNIFDKLLGRGDISLLYRELKRTGGLIDLSSNNAGDAYEECIDHLVRHSGLSKRHRDNCLKQLLEREARAPTFLSGFALPHTQVSFINKGMCLVGRSCGGIRWIFPGQPDLSNGQSLGVFFILFMHIHTPSERTQHIRLLRDVSALPMGLRIAGYENPVAACCALANASEKEVWRRIRSAAQGMDTVGPVGGKACRMMVVKGKSLRHGADLRFLLAVAEKIKEHTASQEVGPALRVLERRIRVGCETTGQEGEDRWYPLENPLALAAADLSSGCRFLLKVSGANAEQMADKITAVFSEMAAESPSGESIRYELLENVPLRE